MENQFNLLVNSFDKVIETNDLSAVMDVLMGIRSLDVTASMIERSKLGNKLSKLRKLFVTKTGATEQEIARVMKEILVKWKKVMEVCQKPSHETSNQTLTLKLKISKPLDPINETPQISSTQAHRNDNNLSNISQQRQKALFFYILNELFVI
jgi:hypothetical protein